MSEDLIALLITTIVIGLALAWVPVLSFLCPPCARALDRMRTRRAVEPLKAAPIRVSDSVRLSRSR
jgi:hypothetical protein